MLSRQGIVVLACAGAAMLSLGSFAVAQDMLDPAAAHEMREENMKGRGGALMILGRMAQGEMEYDATAAPAAAGDLLALVSADETGWWPEGSEAGVLPDSRALPAIWENPDDFAAKGQALIDAATAMNAAAGVDLASLQAAMGPLGGACGACHQTYRAPE